MRIFQKYIGNIYVGAIDGMISVKEENDSSTTTNIVKYHVKSQNKTENVSSTVTSNNRMKTELTNLREKYNQAIFELQKSKETIEMFENEKNSLKLKFDGEKECMINQLNESIKLQNDKDVLLSDLRENQQKLSIEMKTLKKENNELRARLKQIQSSSSFNKQQKKNRNNDNDVFDVEKLLDHKEKKSGRMFLVRWKGFGPDEDQWVSESNLQCPTLLKSYFQQKKHQ